MATADELLKAFVADRQLEGVTLDGDGRAGVLVDGRTPIDFKADGDRLYVYGSLGPVPQARKVEVLTLLMAANRGGALGEGPVMSIDPTLGDIVVSQEIDARSAGSALVGRAVAAVAEHVETWRRRLDQLDSLLRDASGDDGLPGDVPQHAMIRA